MNHVPSTSLPEALAAEEVARFAEGLRDLAGLGGAWVAPSLEPVTLFEQSERLNEPQAARDLLARFAAQPGAFGWIETPQTLRPAGENRALPDGIPLNAELACGRTSLQLRWADGAWVVTHQHEGAAHGLACWAQDVERLASLPGTVRWCYRLYLQASGDGTLQPVGARLAGAVAES